MGARLINFVLGAWLFASAFLWRHTYVQTENAWVVGFMALMMALGGLAGLGWTRYLNVVLGAWLILSPLFVRVASPMTYWNDEVVGAALIVFGLRRTLRLGGGARHRTRNGISIEATVPDPSPGAKSASKVTRSSSSSGLSK